MAIALLIVPAISYAGDAGVTTPGSKVTCKSYEITFLLVVSPTVIGTVITVPFVPQTLPSAAVTDDAAVVTHALPFEVIGTGSPSLNANPG